MEYGSKSLGVARAVIDVSRRGTCGKNLAVASAVPGLGLKHGLQIEGRPADDLEHLRSRRLLLQRLSKVLSRFGEFVGPMVELLSEIVVLSAATARNRRPLRTPELRRRFHCCAAANAIDVMGVRPLIEPSQATAARKIPHPSRR